MDTARVENEKARGGIGSEALTAGESSPDIAEDCLSSPARAGEERRG